MAKVKMVINIEFETWNDETANAAVVRLPFQLRLQILEGTDEQTLPGVLPGTVFVETVEKKISLSRFRTHRRPFTHDNQSPRSES